MSVRVVPQPRVRRAFTDLIRLSHSTEQSKPFVGRKVRSVGLVISEPGKAPKLVRWIMWCCAADALPASVDLSGNLTGPFKDSAWYEVVGTAQFPSTLGQVIPKIDVDTIKPAEEPDEPYLSP